MDLKRHAQDLSRAIIDAHKKPGGKSKSSAADGKKLLLPSAPLDCLGDLKTTYEPTDIENTATLGALPKGFQWDDRRPCEFLQVLPKGKGKQTEGDASASPSLGSIKKHLQAVVNVIEVFKPIVGDSAAQGSQSQDPLDWLQKLSETYENDDATHNEPLHSLRNLLLPPLQSSDDSSVPTYGMLLGESASCPLTKEIGSKDEDGKPELTVTHLTAHANDVLTLLDDRLATAGGILSLQTSEGTPEQAEMAKTLLGQWMQYTAALTRRISDLEREVIASREVLAGEAMVPKQLSSEALQMGEDSASINGGAKPLTWPQDRWVLCDLTPGLYDVLKEKLDDKEKELTAEQSISRLTLGADYRGAPRNVVVWVEVSSRIFRVQGHQTLFMIPGHGIHPNATATTEMEQKPLVQTLPRGVESRSETKWARDMVDRIKNLRADAFAEHEVAIAAHHRNTKLQEDVNQLERELRAVSKRSPKGENYHRSASEVLSCSVCSAEIDYRTYYNLEAADKEEEKKANWNWCLGLFNEETAVPSMQKTMPTFSELGQHPIPADANLDLRWNFDASEPVVIPRPAKPASVSKSRNEQVARMWKVEFNPNTGIPYILEIPDKVNGSAAKGKKSAVSYDARNMTIRALLAEPDCPGDSRWALHFNTNPQPTKKAAQTSQPQRKRKAIDEVVGEDGEQDTGTKKRKTRSSAK